ncbi:ABC transporter ATP-binding protein [Granulicella tundricola]|uniref:ABC transporter related protein n=1 Tax=Granulicella tundricola (strain ATCC BAA-1859 / DSM 23138 / MP5ACTX9) TaxID=1198114 RepID=E8X0K1_GRATM|nr:ATP-binding cassette domain-containing protein [Granulicella tundricola]ADW68952.1 ABC transporter related protein [Granulicella tundricola MP5ACTX9]
MSTFLDLQHVNVVRGGRTVLHDINLQVAKGEQIAILGPNGCGKSTLIKTITCELYPLAQEQTRIAIFGRPRWDLTELKRRLGVVSADLPGKPTLSITGYEAILTGFFSSSTLWPNLVATEVMRERAEEVLIQVDAVRLRDVLFGEMSAGQQRRVMIGRALAGSAECLLLDEPSNALDLLAQRDLRNLIVSLADQGTTMLHITHHIADIIPAMKRVICMKEGRIVADGPREDLLTEANLQWLFGTEVSLSERDGFFHAW